MSFFEKINIYVPEEIGKKLNNDALQFEIFKGDGQSINRNSFLNLLIYGYYSTFEEEQKGKYDAVYSLVDGLCNDKAEKKAVASAIVNKVIFPEIPLRKGKHPAKLSLKSTRKTEDLISAIFDNLGSSDYISQYFCRMLMSYCEKPFSQREQIVFKDNYEMLEKACKEKSCITITTTKEPGKIRHVLPYALVTGTEEMYNYLVCCELDDVTGVLQTRSFRLNRIRGILPSNKILSTPSDIIEKMNRMIEYGPQYVINTDEEICVRLSHNGVKLLSQIYFGRPKEARKEEIDGGFMYYYRCSEDQVFLYFKRFEGADAVIVAPESLKKRIVDFHKSGLEC